VQQLVLNDFGTKIELYNMFQQLLCENHEVLFNFIKSDEAHFHKFSVINKHNYYF